MRDGQEERVFIYLGSIIGSEEEQALGWATMNGFQSNTPGWFPQRIFAAIRKVRTRRPPVEPLRHRTHYYTCNPEEMHSHPYCL